MGEADDSTGSPKVQLIRAVAATILESDGKLDPDLRSAAFHHGASLAGRSVVLTFTLPEPLADFVDKVARHAYNCLHRLRQKLGSARHDAQRHAQAAPLPERDLRNTRLGGVPRGASGAVGVDGR